MVYFTGLCFVSYFTRRFVLCLSLCYFVLVFFSPFSIAITSLGEERANLSAFRTFVRFALVWFCLFPLPLVVWEGQRFVIVALPGLFSYLFFLLISYSVLFPSDLPVLYVLFLIRQRRAKMSLQERSIYKCTKYHNLNTSMFMRICNQLSVYLQMHQIS